MEDMSSIVSRVANETYRHSRKVMPEQPWWDNLESNFHKYPDSFDLDLKTKLMVDSTVAIDLALRTGTASMLSLLALPRSMNPAGVKSDLGNRSFYTSLADQRNPELFFKRPPRNVNVWEAPGSWFHFKPDDGRCMELSFESPFEPVNSRLKKKYHSFRANRRARAQYWRHDDAPRPTIAVIHGFMADPYWLNSAFFALPWFYKQGYDILLYTLPFHGKRAGKTAPFSGHGYFSHGLSHINETVAQSVYDFRIFMDYLEDNGVNQVGVTGISLGGYTSALLACTEERLKFSIPNVPVVSLADLILQWFPAGMLIKTALRAGGVSVQQMRHILAVHCPLTYEPLLPRERLMIVGGAGDRLAPPKHSRLLWDHWGQCKIHWFPGNHVIHLDQGKYLKEMMHFMQGINFTT